VSVKAVQCVDATGIPSAETWWLPVPRSPAESQVCSIHRSTARTNTIRSTPSTSAPSPIQSLCRQLLVNGHRPVSRPSAIRPCGANIVAVGRSGSAKISRAPISGT
jgi:hypothetical protein